MLVATQTTIALRCPSCGKMDFQILSRFALGRGRTVKIACECGMSLVSIANKGKHLYNLQLNCIMCERKHFLDLKGSELWQEKVLTLTCDDTGVEVGFIGPKELVMNSVKRLDRSIREMAEELGYNEYFLSAEIMYQVLDLLRKMAEDARMSCSCGGSQMEVEVFPDRVELTCQNCEAVGIVFAETEKDLRWVQSMEGVFLEAHSYRYLDDKRLKKRRRMKK